MTKNNEQIIIDGVDVTQCGYLCCGKVCSWFDDDCKGYDVCYYKQLKRKEQECEELKEKLEKAGSNLFLTNQALNEYKKEIIKLKKENEKLTQELYGQEKIINRLIKQVDNQKQTFTEIKEIAENSKKDICNNCGWRNTDSCDPTDYTCGEFIKIIEKINEVENVDNN